MTQTVEVSAAMLTVEHYSTLGMDDARSIIFWGAGESSLPIRYEFLSVTLFPFID